MKLEKGRVEHEAGARTMRNWSQNTLKFVYSLLMPCAHWLHAKYQTPLLALMAVLANGEKVSAKDLHRGARANGRQAHPVAVLEHTGGSADKPIDAQQFIFIYIASRYYSSCSLTQADS